MFVLLKIPFIVSDAVGMRITARSPSLTPSTCKSVVPNWREVFLRSLGRPSMLLRALSWVAGGIEILVIVSSYNPSGPVSSLVLHVFSARQCSARISMNQSFLFGSFLTLVGTSLRVYCYKTLGRFFTFDLSIKDGHHLVVTGPYSVVRHPSYTALIMTVIGAASIHATGSWVSECASQHPIGRVLIAYWLLAAAAVVLSLLLRLPNEDEMLRNEFGKVWMEWQRQVPYALIPGLY